MNYTEILNKIAETEGLGQEALDIIKAKMNGYVNDRKAAQQKLEETKTVLSTIAKTAGISEEELQQNSDKLKTILDQKLEELKAAKQSIEAKTKELDETKGKLEQVTAAAGKQSMVYTAAEAAGANYHVLTKLVGNEKLEIKEGKVMVTVGGGDSVISKELRDYAQETDAWKPFVPALFPTPVGKIPTGSSGTGTSQSTLREKLLAKKLNGFGINKNA
ncbi:MAG: hypothetical protein F6J98_01710 [Moorea sp. SIO4G2]|nr:hypothetical protein [Moorena sp. SIO4G2]